MSEVNSDLLSLEQLNNLPNDQATIVFGRCCAADNWVSGMVNARPFVDVEQMLSTAQDVWWKLEESDFLQAFEAHPKIGNVKSLRAKYADTHALAANEQHGASVADEAVLTALADGNQAYEEKFGFIFIVCATGKSAAEMLDLLEQRLPNTYQQEIQNAAENQAMITAIRINKL
ncbi:MAG: 2-oxo-4-hydroxy-4-carboxy-5-ureidoimidazoline decarboxylase, partial [Oleibacter sp.]|nr:2-oxo-4-hydroxy-4-carboxy-5-ureidoimidazoline decarboxylase [Thalassolituus sp.]